MCKFHQFFPCSFFIPKCASNPISYTSKLCPPNFSITALLYQCDNFRTREFQVNKKRGKSETKRKDGKLYKRISHISYKLPLILFIVSLILLYKIFMKKKILRKDVSRSN